MAKALARVGVKSKYDIPRVELIPVQGKFDSDPLRIREIQDLVAKIVLLGSKRGRPCKTEEGVKDAA